MEAEKPVYDHVLGELDNLCSILEALDTALSGSAIEDTVGKNLKQSCVKTQMLEMLKNKVVPLREQVVSDKARIELLEKAAAEGGGNTGAQEKEVHRLQSENQKERLSLENALSAVNLKLTKTEEENKSVTYMLESSNNNARSLQDNVNDLNSRLEAETKRVSPAFVVNTELRTEIDNLCVVQRSATAMERG
jgi:hypothetical protein